MQPFRKERQNKPYKCSHCPKSFKSCNGLKYHSEKAHINEDMKMETGNTEGMIIDKGFGDQISVLSKVLI